MFVSEFISTNHLKVRRLDITSLAGCRLVFMSYDRLLEDSNQLLRPLELSRDEVKFYLRRTVLTSHAWCRPITTSIYC